MEEWLFPLISAIISLSIAGILLCRWMSTKDKSIMWWGVGFLSYFVAHLMETLFALEILPTEGSEYIFLYFIRQSLVAILLVAVLYGVTILLTEKKIWKFVPIILLFVQEVMIIYYDFGLWDTITSRTLQILIFVIPLSTVFAALFLRYWIDCRRRHALLLSLAWFAYAAVVPLYFITKGTDMFPYWFGIRAVTNIILLVGFIDYTIAAEKKPIIEPSKSIATVETPITAMLDLSEEIHEKVPSMKMMMNLIMIFFSAVILIGIIDIALYFNIGTGILLIIIGCMALVFSYEMRTYFKRFIARQSAIKKIRDAEPITHIPKGKTPQERFIKHMKENPLFKQAMMRNLKGIKNNVKLTGRSGSTHKFDIYVESKPSLGYHGYSLFLRCFDKPLKMEEVKDLVAAVKDLVEKTKVVPSGIIALQSFSSDLHDDERGLSDETYDYVMNNPIIFKIGFRKYTRNLQIVTEERDGTYDFIPFIFINEMEN